MVAARQRVVFRFFFRVAYGEAACLGFEFESLSFLRVKRGGGSGARGFTATPSVLPPFNEVAAVRGPLDSAVLFTRKGGVAPAFVGANLPEDIDARHRASPWKKDTIMDANK